MKRNSKIFTHFMKVGNKTSPKLAWNAKTPPAHRAWRRKFKVKLAELLGKMPTRVPLRVDWTEKVERKAFTRHKIYIQSEKDYWIPAYYFLPKSLKGKTPAIICLHGHKGIMPYIREGNEEQRKVAKGHALDYAPFLAENGYITIAPIQRGWNETMHESDPLVSVQGNNCYRMAMDCFMVGMTPIGLKAWDSMRLVDFLKTQSEVDKSRIAAAGLSGGGTTALFFTALDDRVKLAMIAGYYCTFRDSIYEIFHCICNCIPHIMEWSEMSDIAALIAPRPLLIISGQDDAIFPLKATRKAYRKLQETYKLLGSKNNLESDFFEGIHQWSNRKTLSFLQKHLGY